MSLVSREMPSSSSGNALGAGVHATLSNSSQHDTSSRPTLDTAMAELDTGLETVSTLIFELQEQRHSAGDQQPGIPDLRDPADTLSADRSVLLAGLQNHLQTIDLYIAEVETRLQAGLSADPIIASQYDRKKQRSVLLHAQANELQMLADQNEHLQTYHSASKQANDMMVSLEKVCLLCHDLVQTLNNKYGMVIGSSPSTRLPHGIREKLDLHSADLSKLQKSLDQKSKYYVPSCERVLNMIDTGIDQQTSAHGFVLRNHADMKKRWQNLTSRLSRMHLEMASVEELLCLIAERVHGEDALAESYNSNSLGLDSPSSSVSTPSRQPKRVGRSKSASYLSPDPPISNRTEHSPTTSRAISPFHRIAAHLHSNSVSTPSPLPGSRPSLRAMLTDLDNSSRKPSGCSRRAQSPVPSMSRASASASASALDRHLEARPPWKGGTRLDKTVYSSGSAVNGRSRPRPSLPAFGTSRASDLFHDAPPLPQSVRLASFASSGMSAEGRPSSPTQSAMSQASLVSAPRARPTAPNGRISGPTGTAPPFVTGGQRLKRLNATVPSEDDADILSLGGAQSVSAASRPMSPTPSSIAGISRRKSHIPRLSISGAGPPASLSVDKWRETVMTPEPTIRSRAARASAMHMSSVTSLRANGRQSLGIGLPAINRSQAAVAGKTSAPAVLSATLSPHRTTSNSRPAEDSRRISMLGQARPSTRSRFSQIYDNMPGPYIPNDIDPLDVEIAAVLNCQPTFLRCQRIDLQLNKAEAAVQRPVDRIARYQFGGDRAERTCKLVDRGSGRERRVLVKIGANAWQDLHNYLLSLT